MPVVTYLYLYRNEKAQVFNYKQVIVYESYHFGSNKVKRNS